MASSTLWGWGQNLNGEIGDNSATQRNSPVQVGTLSTWSQVSGGGATSASMHTLAVKQDGTLWSWGKNSDGQLGQGTTVDKSSPVQIGTLTNWAAARAGQSHSLATRTDGTLWAWGNNFKNPIGGALGDGTTVSKSSPVQVGTLTTWTQSADMMAAGYIFSVVGKTDGTLWAWGYNRMGQLGNNTGGGQASQTGGQTSSPVQVGAATSWTEVSAQNVGVAARRTDGTLWHWGMWDGANTGLSNATQIGALTTWTDVTSGHNHKLAVKNDGTIWAWGYGNSFGQFGLNNATAPSAAQMSSPTQIGTLTNWSKVSAGQDFSVVTKTDSTLWAWGHGTVGEIGDNAATTRSSPVQIGTLATWTTPANGGGDGFALQGPAAAAATSNAAFLLNFM